MDPDRLSVGEVPLGWCCPLGWSVAKRCWFTVKFCCVAGEVNEFLIAPGQRWDEGWWLRVSSGLVAGGSKLGKGGPEWTRKHDWCGVAEMGVPMRDGVTGRASSESLVGGLESHCTTADFSCSELRPQVMVYISPSDLAGWCWEGLLYFLFPKSSHQTEIPTRSYKDTCWNTFPASKPSLYLLQWNQLTSVHQISPAEFAAHFQCSRTLTCSLLILRLTDTYRTDRTSPSRGFFI